MRVLIITAFFFVFSGQAYCFDRQFACSLLLLQSNSTHDFETLELTRQYLQEALKGEDKEMDDGSISMLSFLSQHGRAQDLALFEALKKKFGPHTQHILMNTKKS